MDFWYSQLLDLTLNKLMLFVFSQSSQKQTHQEREKIKHTGY